MDITLGQIVLSKAGRDAGKKFLVVEVLNETYVMISDGDLRRVEKPKKKKIKHLEITSNIVGPINEKLMNKLRVSNSEIRKSLTEQETNSLS